MATASTWPPSGGSPSGRLTIGAGANRQFANDSIVGAQARICAIAPTEAAKLNAAPARPLVKSLRSHLNFVHFRLTLHFRFAERRSGAEFERPPGGPGTFSRDITADREMKHAKAVRRKGQAEKKKAALVDRPF